MNNKLKEKIEKVLKKEERFWDKENEVLLRNTISEDAEKFSEELLEMLLSGGKEIKEHFFKKVGKVTVFDKDKFLTYINNKDFLEDSYTKFTQNIGLTEDNDFLKSSGKVVLNWPYKDCILEGGQTKEEDKRNEIFFNEILEKDEIDVLLKPKVFSNFKKYSRSKGKIKEEKLEKFSRGEDGIIKDNLIIKGNNLLALHSLREEFAGKIKLIYIDPPYNTGNDGFKYNDNFNHSTWLTFMKNRLKVAKDLLRDDGVIFVQCDDNEQAYLKVLMDEVFHKENYLNTISVKTKASSGASGGGEDIKLKKNIEYLLIFSKGGFNKFNDLYKETALEDYIKKMKEKGTSFKYINVLYSVGDKKNFKTIKDGGGNDIKIFKINGYKIKTVKQISGEENISEKDVYLKYFDKIMTTTNAQTSIRQRVWDATKGTEDLYSIEYIPVSGKNKGKKINLFFMGKQKVLIIWLHNTAIKTKQGILKREKIGTFWDGFSWINIQKEGGLEEKFDNGKKPEDLLRRIIEMSTEEGDRVLDFFAGSGTSCAAAHKMNRQYIGVEQMDYIHDLPEARLKNVIKGDSTGISKFVNWKGGGEFIYMEMKRFNQEFLDAIKKAKKKQDLQKIFKEIKEKAFLSYRFSDKEFKKNISEFNNLELDEQKKVLFELLDKNQMYLPHTEIKDQTFKISKKDIEVNKSFYGK